MRAAICISWMLLRGGGKRSLISAALGVAAVTVSVALLLLTLSFDSGFAGRAERAAWRQPTAAKQTAPTFTQAVSTDFAAGRPVVIVDLATLDGSAPTPPGMPRFPRAGEVWLSPALADLAARLPPDQLADRLLPDTAGSAGTVGPAALVYPDELVAVAGHAAGDPVMTRPRQPDPRRDGDTAGPTPAASYSNELRDFSPEAMYVGLSHVASVLLIVPLLTLAGAAARLDARRRDQRLAMLRLAGASPRQVLVATAVEAASTGVVGAVIGAVLYTAVLPLAARLHVGGGSWAPEQLWLGPPVLAAAVIGSALMAAFSATSRLRRVVSSPLAVAQRHTPARLRAVRLVLLGAALLAYTRTNSADASLTSVLVVLVAAMAVLSVVGPFAITVLAGLLTRHARSAALLLAGRRLLDDPRAAWRGVAALTLAAFITGFLAPYNTSTETSPWGPPDRLVLTVPVSDNAALADVARRRLETAGVDAEVALAGRSLLGGTDGSQDLTITVHGGPAAVDQARTAVHGLVPGQPAVTGTDIDHLDRQLNSDYDTLATLLLLAAFLIAATSTAITAAAAILDQRQTLQQLRLTGAPLRVLYQAQNAQALLPLTLSAGSAMLAGLACAAPYTLLAGSALDLRGTTVLAVCTAAGTATMLIAAALTRPLLRTVMKTSLRRD